MGMKQKNVPLHEGADKAGLRSAAEGGRGYWQVQKYGKMGGNQEK